MTSKAQRLRMGFITFNLKYINSLCQQGCNENCQRIIRIFANEIQYWAFANENTVESLELNVLMGC